MHARMDITGLTQLLLVWCATCQTSILAAEPTPKTAIPTVATAVSPQAKQTEQATPLDGPVLKDVPTWSEMIRAVLLTAIPDQYEDKSHWGKTNEMFDGLDVKQRGFDIRVKERKKRVNNGLWQRFKVRLVNPKKNLKLLIGDFQQDGLNRYRFDVLMSSQMLCRGDMEHWLMGVKGFNISVESEAEVEIRASCQLVVKTEFQPKSMIPDLILQPRVMNVSLRLTDLEVRRIGEIRGDLAEGLGDSTRGFVENLIRAQGPKVLKKANEAIDKKRDQLRVPLSRLWK